MPFITHGIAPPAPRGICTKTMQSPTATPTAHQPIHEKTNSALQIGTVAKEGESEAVEISAYPVVKLDTDTITDETAGRLASSLLGHVLFLKNQVPFPVQQLGRIPGGQTNSRAFKQRTELLSSYDTISSHLDTTFSALSTALARSSRHTQRKVALAYLAILVGPSIGTAKSKVFLGIDGLEMRVWGEDRVTAQKTKEQEKEAGDDDDDSEVEGGSEDDSDDEASESAEEPEDSEEEDEASDEDQSIEDENGDESDSGNYSVTDNPSPPPPYVSHAEQQRFLQNADRLLSRILATADAGGNGITSEMTPTQTHVLIRAPRRFEHPAWIPRQNIAASLDAALSDFLLGTGIEDPDLELPSAGVPKQNKRNSKVEGVWIAPRTGIRRRSLRHANPTSIEHNDAHPALDMKTQDSEKVDEGDEMIWWSWDGRFVGFADW
ncbi:unnamed protein product [Cyclocybe aegerita]|uniref:Uncharacterized protein n=1 Tax=Cyclocybe aegerita TaxID=1973307 RepID=A0A8S0XR33_CYCAE|nr:unnamed protein product [Cyclocybe aegerita]